VSNRSTARKRSESPGAPAPTAKRRASRRAHPPLPLPRPFEPGRAEPPIPILDDLDEYMAPPLHGKVHPPAEMGDAIPTLDDAVRAYHHHPNDAGATEFGFDPDAADAAADLAGDLGTTFLEGATSGDDMSDIAAMHDDRDDSDVPFLLEDEDEEFASPGRAAEPASPEPTNEEADEEPEPETQRMPRRT
jgi:hypothetical protein